MFHRSTLLLLSVPVLALGYVDPFTGSILLQVLIGGFLATLLVVRKSLAKCRRAFWRLLRMKGELRPVISPAAASEPAAQSQGQAHESTPCV